MGIRYKKNQPKRPKLKLDSSSDIGQRLKQASDVSDTPRKKPVAKPTVIKPYNINSSSSIKNRLPSKPATADDLADIWTEQEKIKLAREAEEKLLKEAKKAKKLAKKLDKQKQKKQKIKHKPLKAIGSRFNFATLTNNKLPKSIINDLTSAIPGNKKSIKYTVAALVLIPVAVVGFLAISKIFVNNDNAEPKGTSVQGESVKKADFSILSPSGINNATVKYDDKKKVVSFADKVSGVNIIVSQQVLPENFKSDSEGGVRKMAEQFYANIPLKADSTTAYLGNSVKGPQTVIFSKNGLLIFIQSESVIDQKTWITYINTLKQATN